MGFLYSVAKNLKYKIAVIDIFRYFKEKSSRILVPFLLAVMINFIGLIINFQVLGVLVDKKFMAALKDGFNLTLKFLNPKVLLILIGEDIFLIISILNGSFTGFVYFINFIVSLYLIDFYFEENTIIERKE